jgi:hypothetical protein
VFVERIFNCYVSPYDGEYRIFSINCSFYSRNSNHAGKYKYLDLGVIDKNKYEHE